MVVITTRGDVLGGGDDGLLRSGPCDAQTHRHRPSPIPPPTAYGAVTCGAVWLGGLSALLVAGSNASLSAAWRSNRWRAAAATAARGQTRRARQPAHGAPAGDGRATTTARRDNAATIFNGMVANKVRTVGVGRGVTAWSISTLSRSSSIWANENEMDVKHRAVLSQYQ